MKTDNHWVNPVTLGSLMVLKVKVIVPKKKYSHCCEGTNSALRCLCLLFVCSTWRFQNEIFRKYGTRKHQHENPL